LIDRYWSLRSKGRRQYRPREVCRKKQVKTWQFDDRFSVDKLSLKGAESPDKPEQIDGFIVIRRSYIESLKMDFEQGDGRAECCSNDGFKGQ
jgi:hypothetical protein